MAKMTDGKFFTLIVGGMIALALIGRFYINAADGKSVLS